MPVPTPDPSPLPRPAAGRSPRVEAIELSDPDGDGLTFTADARGLWATVTSWSDEVTVGPFSPKDLRSALTALSALTSPAQAC